MERQAKAFSIGIGLGIVIVIRNRDSEKDRTGSGEITIRPNKGLRYRLNHTFKAIHIIPQRNLVGNSRREFV
jgi:hypothetical protein